MSFGRNPHVPKAQAAELKAEEAGDDASWARACHEAAHEWERAAKREKPGKLRDTYERNAVEARERASLSWSEREAGREAPDEDDTAAPLAASEAPTADATSPQDDGVVVGLFSGRGRRGAEE